MLNTSKGFTLIELLIVMAILGMLAALVGPSLFKQLDAGKVSTASTQMSSIEAALDSYRLDLFKYPKSLEALVKNTTNSPKWHGPYLKKSIPKDPWGNEYQYRSPGRERRDYDLYSFGADGREGGEEIDADIKSWEIK
ncbi:MAG TPA: type II secretion system protein GspG [Thioploca sp.]|nr:type II secretion system protein GspG [Thioploca sp.]